jgi:hypothetical protein
MADTILGEILEEILPLIDAKVEKGPNGSGQMAFLECRGVPDALAIEVWITEDNSFLITLGADMSTESGGQPNEVRAELRALIWGAINAGAGRYRIGFRKYWIVGDHADIAARLHEASGFKRMRLLETRRSWSDGGPPLLPGWPRCPDRYFLFPG